MNTEDTLWMIMLGTPVVGFIGMYVSNLICAHTNVYVIRHSPQFSSIDDIKKILPEEKKKLRMEDYDISLKLLPKGETSRCDFLEDGKREICLAEDHLNLGILRHELRHSKQTFPSDSYFSYFLFDEPAAVRYSLTALKENRKSE